MKILMWLSLLALILLSLFAVGNWTTLTATTTLSFLGLAFDAPLGLLLLGAAVIVIALFAIYALSLHASLLVEVMRHAKELEAQRALAEQAEQSRYTALGTQLDHECERLRAQIDDVAARLSAQGENLERSLLKMVAESSNSLAAYLGEIDDRQKRAQPLPTDSKSSRTDPRYPQNG